jgi:hypothetical protein
MLNTSQTGQTLEVELMALVAAEDWQTVYARVRGLSLNDYIRVMKALQALEDALIEYGEKWEDSCYWGRGTPWPDEAERDAA